MPELLAIGAGLLVGAVILNWLQQQQQRQRVEAAFYQLLERQNGCLSLIQLVAAARMDARLVKPYLEQQAQLLGAALEVDADGDTFYRFPKLKRPNNLD